MLNVLPFPLSLSNIHPSNQNVLKVDGVWGERETLFIAPFALFELSTYPVFRLCHLKVIILKRHWVLLFCTNVLQGAAVLHTGQFLGLMGWQTLSVFQDPGAPRSPGQWDSSALVLSDKLTWGTISCLWEDLGTRFVCTSWMSCSFWVCSHVILHGAGYDLFVILKNKSI